jgi:hypothetical protein
VLSGTVIRFCSSFFFLVLFTSIKYISACIVCFLYIYVCTHLSMYVCIYMHVHVAGTVFSLALILWIPGVCWAKIVTYNFAGLRRLVALEILVECVYLDCMNH